MAAEQKTPSTIEIQSGTTPEVSPANVKIAMGSPSEGPTIGKMVHVLAVLVAGLIAVCVTAVLADGMSVIKLKDFSELPVITSQAPDVVNAGFNHRLDELMGPTYGIGLHHDQSGRSWSKVGAGSSLANLLGNLGNKEVIAAALPNVISRDSLKHPVPLLECDDLKMAGMSAMSLGFIADSVAILMVLFHALVLAGVVPAKVAKPLSVLVWLVLTIGFFTVCILAVGIYTATWECNQPIIPTLKLSDHFDYSYGFAFANLGYLCCLLMCVLMICCTSSSERPAKLPLGAAALKTVGGLTVGLTCMGIFAVVCAASNDAFKGEPAVDSSVNMCAGQKPYHADFGNNKHGDNYFANTDCTKDAITQTLEQAGANVTAGFRGLFDAGDRVPITVPYSQTDLCPVNVHWHLGAEHLSVGEFDEYGTGPADGGDSHAGDSNARRALAGSNVRKGFQCRHYTNENDPMFSPSYNWEHCTNMLIGETYEIHWPHSAAGACGTEWQYQTPFYDGVFCKDGIIKVTPLNTYQKIGVQSQVFTVVNSDDPQYYYPNLIDGMLVGGTMGQDIAKYTGSTTGTSRDNEICSRFTPITWQVDRKCHLVSASSFDKLCYDMKQKADDMSGDLYPHGARELVANHLVADNQQSRK